MAEPLDKRAMLALFRAERENSFRAAGRRQGGGSSSGFQVVEARGVVLLQGRKYNEGPDHDPSIMRMDAHEVLPEYQAAAYNVPLLSPTSALGRSAAEAVHDMAHGISASSTAAKSSRYFYFIPSNLPYFKHLREACYTCRKVSQQRGRPVIAPLRSIGLTDMVEGMNLMLDTFGPVILKSRPSQPATRGATHRRRDTVKLYVLLSVCMYSHRISAAVLDSMTTESLVSGLNTIMLEHGYRTKRMAFDAGSSLIPAAAATA